MNKCLKLARLDIDLSSSTAEKNWLHWIRTFKNFVSALPTKGLNKLQVLTNYISPQIFEYIKHCNGYDDDISTTLRALYIKPTKEVFARYLLVTRRQKSGETMDSFLQALKSLAWIASSGTSPLLCIGMRQCMMPSSWVYSPTPFGSVYWRIPHLT